MKRILCTALTAVMAMSSVSGVVADKNTVNINFNGEPVDLSSSDAAPFIENGTTMIPIRTVS